MSTTSNASDLGEIARSMYLTGHRMLSVYSAGGQFQIIAAPPMLTHPTFLCAMDYPTVDPISPDAAALYFSYTMACIEDLAHKLARPGDLPYKTEHKRSLTINPN